MLSLSDIIVNYSDRSFWKDVASRDLVGGTRLVADSLGGGFRVYFVGHLLPVYVPFQ